MKRITLVATLIAAALCLTATVASAGELRNHPLVKKCVDDNDAKTCAKLGFALLKSKKATPKTKKLAVAFFTRACKLRDAKSCTMAGAILFMGKGVKKDVKAALRLLDHGCKLGDDNACQAMRKIARKAGTTYPR